MTSTDPKRLLFVTTGLGSGGAETMLAQIVTRLQSESLRCTVASLASGGKYVDELRAAGVDVHDLGIKPGKPSILALWRLWKIASTLQPHALIGWMYHGNLAATLVQRGTLRSVPLLWNIRQTLYSLDLEKRGSAFVIRLLARLSKRRPQSIIYNSHLSAEQHEAIGYDDSKTQLVPNGFDTSRFQPNPEARIQIRRELFLPEDAFLIGRIGRNAAMKDHATALAAAASLCRNHPNVHFLFAGTGMTKDDPAFADFFKKQPGTQSQIHFLGERHDLPRLTAALDLAISTSAFGEGFPNVIGEAMASAIPVIATDIGDTARVLDDPDQVVPPRNPQALVKSCEAHIHSSSETRQQIGQRNLQRIQAHFDINQVLQTYAHHFTIGVSPSGGPSIRPQDTESSVISHQ